MAFHGFVVGRRFTGPIPSVESVGDVATTPPRGLEPRALGARGPA